MASEWAYSLTETAEQDLDGIVDYLVNRLSTPRAATTLLDEIEKRLVVLCGSPEAGTPAENPSLRMPGVRKIAVQRYLLYYVPDFATRRVVVLRVGHSLQNQDRLLSEM